MMQMMQRCALHQTLRSSEHRIERRKFRPRSQCAYILMVYLGKGAPFFGRSSGCDALCHINNSTSMHFSSKHKGGIVQGIVRGIMPVRKSRAGDDRLNVDDVRTILESESSGRIICLSDFVSVLTGTAVGHSPTRLFTQSALYQVEEWKDLSTALFPKRGKGNCPSRAVPSSRLEDVVHVMDKCKKMKAIRPHIPVIIKKLRGLRVSESEDLAMQMAIESRDKAVVPGVLYAVTSPILDAVKIGMCCRRNMKRLRNRYVTPIGPLAVLTTYETSNIHLAEACAMANASEWHLYGELFNKEFLQEVHSVVQKAAKTYKVE